MWQLGFIRDFTFYKMMNMDRCGIALDTRLEYKQAYIVLNVLV